ncbi:hypothetical protein, partial [Streptomyces sp. NPDC056907]|uniref:hypothetical protein n=2 Tax=Streptomyces TaxID=1883 RepID=UPI00346FBC45
MDTGAVAVIGAASAAPVRTERDPGVLAELTGVPLPADHAVELEFAWLACEDAGIGADDLAGVGVYLAADGAGGDDASETARVLGFAGPCLTGHDPVADAVAAVRSGECDLALVGADGAFAVLTRGDSARTATFAYRLGTDDEWPDGVPALVEAALLSGRPEPGRPEPGRPEPGRPEPGRPEPGRPEPGRPEPG